MLSSSSEAARALTLQRYNILDTPRELEFDRLVELVSKVFHAPIALISFLDGERQWFKAEVGLGIDSTEIGCSICRHAVESDAPVFVIGDTLLDEKTAANRLVTGEPKVRFYAGASLITHEGVGVGTLCILDYVPRQLDPHQKELLASLARQVVLMLEARTRLEIRDLENNFLRGEAVVRVEELQAAQNEGADLKVKLAERKDVLAIVTHDLRSPMTAITLVGHLMKEMAAREPSPTIEKLSSLLVSASDDMSRLVADLTDISVIEQGQLRMKFEIFAMADLVESLKLSHAMLAEDAGVLLRFDLPEVFSLMLKGDPYRLRQALSNLVGNAIRYTPKGETIAIGFNRSHEGFSITVTNPGVGIAPESLDRIFDHFWSEGTGLKRGRGIGLSIARAVARGHGGEISVSSEVGGLTTFKMTIPSRGISD
ncbi:GAF domain-containing sensor histidine kinase [Luteolibacter flavescens]|uniref:histidine kinase n=2 Tax=Luteolibacter flavescens TaxID=1859460 RepID=A0ABT3FPX1_9BACT|nr:GAF domain-containing sensor histidine kinase [Luteolibacter flavescens]